MVKFTVICCERRGPARSAKKHVLLDFRHDIGGKERPDLAVGGRQNDVAVLVVGDDDFRVDVKSNGRGRVFINLQLVIGRLRDPVTTVDHVAVDTEIDRTFVNNAELAGIAVMPRNKSLRAAGFIAPLQVDLLRAIGQYWPEKRRNSRPLPTRCR